MLNLAGCSKITDAILPEIAKLAQLRTLNLSDLHKIGSVGQLQPLQNLEWLALARCKQITDDQVGQMLQGAGKGTCGIQLLELSLQGCHLVTDKAICCIKKSCPHLEVLSIASLPAVKLSSIEMLLSSIETLQQVEISGCTGLARPAVKALAAKYPEVQGLVVEHFWPEWVDPIIEHKYVTMAVLLCLVAYLAQFPQFWFVMGPLTFAVFIYTILGKMVWHAFSDLLPDNEDNLRAT